MHREIRDGFERHVCVCCQVVMHRCKWWASASVGVYTSAHRRMALAMAQCHHFLLAFKTLWCLRAVRQVHLFMQDLLSAWRSSSAVVTSQVPTETATATLRSPPHQVKQSTLCLASRTGAAQAQHRHRRRQRCERQLLMMKAHISACMQWPFSQASLAQHGGVH